MSKKQKPWAEHDQIKRAAVPSNRRSSTAWCTPRGKGHVQPHQSSSQPAFDVVHSREKAITMRCIILSVFRCCFARAYEQKKTKNVLLEDLRCSPARNPCAVAFTPPSPQDHSRCEHGALYAPAVQWRQTQRTGWPTYRFEVCVRTGMVHNRDDDKFDRQPSK